MTYRIAVRTPDDKPGDKPKYYAIGRGGESYTNEPGFDYVEGTLEETENFAAARNRIEQQRADNEDDYEPMEFKAVPYPPLPLPN